ncbi:MAG: DUF3617 family protein [Deltaproteobacteria bacterium]|nr:DUF3617 family protein [Candidatus Anaeroferrophillus wilburensis]MBN2890158.1 DUF3617 family protein [Deltaproteobacteria bacterium]
MSIRMVAVVFILSFSLGAGSALAQPNLNPGKWEISTETEMTGMGNMKMQPQTHVQCLTEEDLVPQNKEASNECQVSDIQQHGDTVSWKITCSGQGGQMIGTGQATYRGDTMSGTMDMEISGTGMRVKNIFRGRRIGDCDSSETNRTSQQPTRQTARQEPAADTSILAEDAKDVGKAARDEAKQSTIDEVREGVRGLFKGVFK